MGEEGYSFSLTTFSPSGKLLQIEHAFKAVQGGKSSIGIQGEEKGAGAEGGAQGGRKPPPESWRLQGRERGAEGSHRGSRRLSSYLFFSLPTLPAATNGVVLATEKKLPSILVDEESVERIVQYTGNIGE